MFFFCVSCKFIIFNFLEIIFKLLIFDLIIVFLSKVFMGVLSIFDMEINILELGIDSFCFYLDIVCCIIFSFIVSFCCESFFDFLIVLMFLFNIRVNYFFFSCY